MAALLTCETDPLTGKTTLALVSNDELFVASFQQYEEFLKENTVIKTGKDAEMVTRLGDNIRKAAEKWYTSKGSRDYLKDYRWEYKLVDDPQVNAWCLPGGKIVVYTGILPVTGDEDALATVMGHEVAHALLNHGRQRVSVAFLENLGLAAAGLAASLSGASEQTQSLFLSALGIGSTLAVALPFSRENESEADHYGLILMAIAGYDPEASVPFWERMAAQGSGGTPEFLSTHPSPDTRIKDLQKKSIPEAKKVAAKLRLDDLKEAIPKAKKTAAEINKQ
jgi:predicted Zn-dependent protease